jgi:DNA mismatch endonuclease (patch repair protein)
MADNLTPQQRQKTMRAVKGKGTSLEKVVSTALHARGLRYRRCVAGLPGKPDFVFTRARVVVFVDGSYWHGWRFPQWKDSLNEYWQKKIERNRVRDRKNFRKLRRQGWTVVRFWDHQVQRDLDGVVAKVAALVSTQGQKGDGPRERTASRPRLQIFKPSARRKQAGQAARAAASP